MQRFRPAVEDMVHNDVGFRHAYPGVRTNDGFFQMNMHHFVEFACEPATPEFAEAPQVPHFDGKDAEPNTAHGVTLLDFNESKNW